MAALDEDEIFDEENFQESDFLSFSPEVQAAIDQVDCTLTSCMFIHRAQVFLNDELLCCKRGNVKTFRPRTIRT